MGAIQNKRALETLGISGIAWDFPRIVSSDVFTMGSRGCAFFCQ